eukprot:TRINITY_DN1936_c0_g3_i2.p1 TRINITY_DN1936_c0_g3~~TRINITY_DN1936_c0_g3_i2.p1  ORF type:complete len:350 (+),score=43.44 TRINITY_DN1936_c0_g3_i2:102-1052(+)
MAEVLGMDSFVTRGFTVCRRSNDAENFVSRNHSFSAPHLLRTSSVPDAADKITFCRQIAPVILSSSDSDHSDAGSNAFTSDSISEARALSESLETEESRARLRWAELQVMEAMQAAAAHKIKGNGKGNINSNAPSSREFQKLKLDNRPPSLYGHLPSPPEYEEGPQHHLHSPKSSYSHAHQYSNEQEMLKRVSNEEKPPRQQHSNGALSAQDFEPIGASDRKLIRLPSCLDDRLSSSSAGKQPQQLLRDSESFNSDSSDERGRMAKLSCSPGLYCPHSTSASPISSPRFSHTPKKLLKMFSRSRSNALHANLTAAK